MKNIEKPAKRIFSQNKEMKKSLDVIAVENLSKKKKSDEKNRKRKDSQNATIENPTKTLKSLSSDQKRLESLKKWQKQLHQQKSTLKNALSINNSEDGLNKKVIFDDNDEESEANTCEIQKPKPLFDESSLEESDTEEKLAEAFRYKKEFEGKSGRKLKELQKKYGDDERFKLSEIFLDDEDLEENAEELADNEDPDGIKDGEIENTLKIANEILQNNEIRIKSKSTKMFKDMTALRFDPDKTQHKEMIQSPTKPCKKKPPAVENTFKNKETPTLPKVENSSYYEVENSLKEAFTNSTEKPFSLLASFADPDVPIEAETSDDEEKKEDEMVFEKPRHQEDNNSSDENENAPCTELGLESETIMEYPDKKFFFLADDKRLTEGVQLFHRTKTEEQMWYEWKAQERKIKMLFHTRQKHIVRRLNYKKSAGSSKKKIQ